MKSNNKKLIAGSLGVLACLMNLVTSDAHARPGLTGPSVKGTYAARHDTDPCLIPSEAILHLAVLTFDLSIAWSHNAPNTEQLAIELEDEAALYAPGGDCNPTSSGLTSSAITQSTGGKLSPSFSTEATSSESKDMIEEENRLERDFEGRNTPSEPTMGNPGEEGPTTRDALNDFTPKAQLIAGLTIAAVSAMNHGNPEGRAQAEPTLLEVREGHQGNS
ncbi:MAG: hypothetical protein SGJ02_05965, partial [bacterium]|mgnify:CR=1 FL=1|nr:hypothetical protein [bacterium]